MPDGAGAVFFAARLRKTASLKSLCEKHGLRKNAAWA
jgi:hypothetical protein